MIMFIKQILILKENKWMVLLIDLRDKQFIKNLIN
jgi:hypothetical protein